MRYTDQEQLREIMRRGEALRKRKDRHVSRGLAASATALFILLAVCIGTFGKTGYANVPTAYGSFLLSAEAGGYVLAAVVAFALGVVVTVLILRHKWRNRQDKE